MEQAQQKSRIEMIDLELQKTSTQVRQLREEARQKKRRNDYGGYQQTTHELTRLLSRREMLKSERLSLAASSDTSSS